jgi:hypothetical protein
LLLIGIEQAFRRQQLEHSNTVVQRPAMGCGAVAQLALGLRQRDIKPFFSGTRAFEQELQRNGCLAGSRGALHQKNMPARKPAR